MFRILAHSGAGRKMPDEDEKGRALRLIADVLNDAGLLDVYALALAGVAADAKTGEPVPLYVEEHEDFGRYELNSWPLEAVVRLVAEMREAVDAQTITANLTSGGRRVIAFKDRFKPHVRENIAALGAHYAVAHFIASLGLNLRAAIEDTFEEAKLMGEVAYTMECSRVLEQQQGTRNPKIDVREELEQATRRAAKRRRERLRALLKKASYVISASKIGRPLKVTDESVRRALREHGKVSKERAAELLDCGVSTLTEWAAGTQWGTWTKARAALLEQVKTDGN